MTHIFQRKSKNKNTETKVPPSSETKISPSSESKVSSSNSETKIPSSSSETKIPSSGSETKVPSPGSDNESVDTLSLENETLSLDNESFISFKTKTNSTVDISLKSITQSFSNLSITFKRKKEQLITTVKDKLKGISSLSFKNDFKNFIDKEKDKKLEDNFLGYYECIIPNNKELSIPKIYLSTARIDLHEEKSENSEKAKRLVLTKIKESPYNPFNNNIISLFIITGKHEQNSNGTGWTGIKYNKLPKWMLDDSIKYVVNCTPVKGLGTYNVFVDKTEDTNIFKNIELNKLEEKAKNENGYVYKMILAGYYMIGIKENNSIPIKLIPEAEKWYKEAVKWCQKAADLGSIEAKLCLGYMCSIGFSILHYDPQKAKKWYKEVIDTIEKAEATDKKATEENATNEVTENASKELVRIATRNVALLYHNSYVIKPFEWKNFVKITKLNELTFKKLTKQKLELAIKWYKKSCELGDSQSAYNLGLLYENDQKIKNKSEAEKWFKMAVQFDNNNLYAKAKLGRILINKGNSDENEKMEGIEMLKYAAENGLVMGQTFLGEAYERGQIGEKINDKEAIKFYFKAAKQNRGYYSHVAQLRLRDFRASNKILAGEEDIENVIKIYVEELKYYYDDNSVNVPFGRAAEWYIANHSLLKDRRLKSQSRLYTSELVKEGIDDIISLTSKVHELLEKINSKIKRDKLCCHGLMYCAGDGNVCQRVCGEVEGSIKDIKSKLLMSMNGANEETLSKALANQRMICTDNNKLRQLIARDDKRLKDISGPLTGALIQKRKTNQIRKAKRGDRNEKAVLNEFNIALNTSYTNQSPTSSSTFQFPTPITTNFHPSLYNSYTNPLYNLPSSLHNTHTQILL
ncbi:hypothetical protein GLOIN_2v1545986 [Rhizophagus irregularis DAOM 181602=DAOM 197198]|nr:hypothetical protein GLOIN_2v1545986 [Rhizophagus irregularis DAOM 181602=DAOM 197198]